VPDYNSNEIVDRLLVLGECRGNYRRAATYHQRFPRKRHHPNESIIRIINRASWTTQNSWQAREIYINKASRRERPKERRKISF